MSLALAAATAQAGAAAEPGLAGSFGALDWAVVGGFLVLATLIGGPLAGKQATIRDFFLGGRRLPWWAVAASLIATEISAVTLVSLPWVVYRPGGNLAYLQLGLIGMTLARLIVAWRLVPAYYEGEVLSPYDYMQAKLGSGARSAATALFAGGQALAQSARVFLTALVLEILLHEQLAWLELHTGLPPLVASIAAIGIVAVVWTWLGGIATVVWTDLVLFCVLLGAALIALLTVVSKLDGGFELLWEVGRGSQKLVFLDASPDPTRPYTLWAALFGATWMGVAVFGTDQLMAQRLLCCRDRGEARKAMVASSAGILVTLIVALVGIGLFAWYERHPLEGEALRLFEQNGDRIFPLFVRTVVASGLKGLIVAGIFAAAISSLDSILAALAQTTLSAAWLPWRERLRGGRALAPLEQALEERRAVRVSRGLVLAFGLLLCVLAVTMQLARERYGSVLDLALALAGYTQGALLAGFLLAFLRLARDASGYVWSAPLSALAVFAVAWHTPWARQSVDAALGLALLGWLVLRLPRDLRAGALAAGKALLALLLLALGLAWLVRYGQVDTLVEREGDLYRAARPLDWPWYVPIGCTVALAWGVLLQRPAPGRSGALERAPDAGVGRADAPSRARGAA